MFFSIAFIFTLLIRCGDAVVSGLRPALTSLILLDLLNDLVLIDIALLNGRHVHREGEGAALHLTGGKPDLAVVALAQMLAYNEAKAHSLIVQLGHILQFSKLLK